jgi:hypothetical protein
VESRIEKQLGIVNHILRREDGKTKISMKRRSGWRKQSEKHMDRNRLEQEKEYLTAEKEGLTLQIADAREIEETSVSGAFEICVSCGKQTDIPREMDISERSFYIEGAGQLCKDCYYQLYGPGHARK